MYVYQRCLHNLSDEELDNKEDLLSLLNLPRVLISHPLENLMRGENISLACRAGTVRSELFNTLLPLFASCYQHTGFGFNTLQINHFAGKQAGCRGLQCFLQRVGLLWRPSKELPSSCQN